MKLIKKGAEGDLFLTVWDKQKAVLKARKEKNYEKSDKLREEINNKGYALEDTGEGTVIKSK